MVTENSDFWRQDKGRVKQGGGEFCSETEERERERERERELGTGILFEEPNPTGSRPFIQEGNREPVSKATHARYREGPVRPRVRR